jgi:uncharacterized sulfatase
MPRLIVLLLLLFCVATAAAKPPNILWISAEDISPDLRCYGDEYSISPNLDRLASQGVRFDRAFSSAPVCAPSRSSIITGMYATSVGSHRHRSDVMPPAYAKCFTEYLRAAGYFCTNNSKTDYNFPPPLTAWDENGKDGHWRHRGADQPFFAVLNLTSTHESQGFDHNVPEGLTSAERHDPARATLPPYYPDTPLVRASWAHWYDCITAMDKQVQQLLDELEKDGLAKDTIVFFWGDHGRGLPRGKRWLYDSGLRVPLIVRWPGKIKAGSARGDLVSLLDLGPTLLSIAGVTPPSYMQGRAFLGDGAQPPPKYLFATRDRMDETYDMMRSVRGERFHYIRNFQSEKPYAQHISYGDRLPIMQEWRRLDAEGSLKGPAALFFAKTKPAEELYDTQTDPHEVNNLAAAAEHQGTLETMRAALIDWMQRTNDLGFVPEPTGSPTTQPRHPRPFAQPPIAKREGDQVTLTAMTPGSSIAYTTDQGRPVAWRLYTAPVKIPAGGVLRAKACRAGFADSEEIRITADAANSR